MRASDYRRIARERLAGNWWLSIGVALIAAALGGTIAGTAVQIRINVDTETLPQALVPIFMARSLFLHGLSLAQFILGGVISVGFAQYLLDQHDGQPLQFKTLFSKFDQFGAGFCLKLLTTLFAALWMLLLVVPGIIALYSYAMAPFIMAENPNITAREAIRASKDMMYGHKWELFCLDLSLIGWILLSVLTLGIGSLFLTPYQSATRAAFYRQIAAPSVE